MGDMGVQGWYDERILPHIMDRSLRDPVAGDWRTATCGPASGDVVELGFGSGLNLRHYGPHATKVHAVEPSALAWELAQRRIEKAGVDVEHVGIDGARLDLDDASADTVVTTWSLCTIPGVEAALAEAKRVLKPGGVLRFAEHSISPDPKVERRQRRYQWWWGRLSGGCHLDRDIPALLDAAGFDVTLNRQDYALEGSFSRPWCWFMHGVATPRG